MCIAQKTLKSMPSTTPEMNQNNDEMDDLIYSPKSGAASPILSPSGMDRHLSIAPPTEENFSFDQHSTVTQTIAPSDSS